MKARRTKQSLWKQAKVLIALAAVLTMVVGSVSLIAHEDNYYDDYLYGVEEYVPEYDMYEADDYATDEATEAPDECVYDDIDYDVDEEIEVEYEYEVFEISEYSYVVEFEYGAYVWESGRITPLHPLTGSPVLDYSINARVYRCNESASGFRFWYERTTNNNPVGVSFVGVDYIIESNPETGLYQIVVTVNITFRGLASGSVYVGMF